MFNPNEFKQAFETVVEVMQMGERNHDPDQWKSYPPDFHIARAAAHWQQWLSGDQSEDHLSHACTRLMIALTLRDVS
jgi:hypothetical protein